MCTLGRKCDSESTGNTTKLQVEMPLCSDWLDAGGAHHLIPPRLPHHPSLQDYSMEEFFFSVEKQNA